MTYSADLIYTLGKELRDDPCHRGYATMDGYGIWGDLTQGREPYAYGRIQDGLAYYNFMPRLVRAEKWLDIVDLSNDDQAEDALRKAARYVVLVLTGTGKGSIDYRKPDEYNIFMGWINTLKTRNYVSQEIIDAVIQDSMISAARSTELGLSLPPSEDGGIPELETVHDARALFGLTQVEPPSA
jgi:hypothetical protein